MPEQGIEEREHGVRGIPRRAPATAREGKLRLGSPDQVGEGAEIGMGPFPFQPAKRVGVRGGQRMARRVVQPARGVVDRRPSRFVHAGRVIPQPAAEHRALVRAFRCNDAPGGRQSVLGLGRRIMLGAPEQNIAALRALDPRLEAPVLRGERQGDAVLGEKRHERRGEAAASEADDPVDQMCRHAADFAALHLDHDIGAALRKPGALGRHVDRVEKPLHSARAPSTRLASQAATSGGLARHRG